MLLELVAANLLVLPLYFLFLLPEFLTLSVDSSTFFELFSFSTPILSCTAIRISTNPSNPFCVCCMLGWLTLCCWMSVSTAETFIYPCITSVITVIGNSYIASCAIPSVVILSCWIDVSSFLASCDVLALSISIPSTTDFSLANMLCPHCPSLLVPLPM